MDRLQADSSSNQHDNLRCGLESQFGAVAEPILEGSPSPEGHHPPVVDESSKLAAVEHQEQPDQEESSTLAAAVEHQEQPDQEESSTLAAAVEHQEQPGQEESSTLAAALEHQEQPDLEAGRCVGVSSNPAGVENLGADQLMNAESGPLMDEPCIRTTSTPCVDMKSPAEQPAHAVHESKASNSAPCDEKPPCVPKNEALDSALPGESLEAATPKSAGEGSVFYESEDERAKNMKRPASSMKPNSSAPKKALKCRPAAASPKTQMKRPAAARASESRDPVEAPAADPEVEDSNQICPNADYSYKDQSGEWQAWVW